MPHSIKNAKILIVDGLSDVDGPMASHLRRGGYSNIARASVEDAVAAARRQPPDLIVADVDADSASGPALCRLVRAEARLTEVPVLLATDFTQAEVRAAIFAAGATDLIFKPVNAEELLARVGVHLERRRLVGRLMDFQNRIAEEIEHARGMQESLLPAPFEIGEIEGRYPVKLASYYKASLGLGGDMWGMQSLSPSRLLVFSADFSGHGVGAALNTFRLHSFLLGSRHRTSDAAGWLEQANRFLCDVLPIGQFATMFCGIIDFEANTLSYAVASSPPPLLLSAHEPEGFRAIDSRGLPLGVVRHESYRNFECAFEPGSVLFLFSDALIETPTPSDPIFTPAGLAAFLDGQGAHCGPEHIRDAVIGRLHAAPLRGTPSDDLTILVLQHLGEPG